MFRRLVSRRPLNRLNSSRLFRRPRLWLTSLEERAVPATFTVNALTDTGTGAGNFGDLRYALTNYAAGDTIDFDPTLFGSAQTITLSGVLPTVSKDVTIINANANRVTLQGAGTGGILRIDNASTTTLTVSVSGLKLVGGSTTTSGGAIYIENEKVTINNSEFMGNAANIGGGAVHVNTSGGTLTVTNSKFESNLATVSSVGAGGAIRVASSAASQTITLNGNEFITNSATGAGGAVFIAGASGQTISLTNNKFTSNATTGSTTVSTNAGGGGIYVGSTPSMTLNGDVFDGNVVQSATLKDLNIGGGAIHARAGIFFTANDATFKNSNVEGWGGALHFHATVGNVTLNRSTISGNTASGSGGGIYFWLGGPVSMTNSTMVNNSAEVGGGVFSWSPTVTITNSTISDNTATVGGGGGWWMQSGGSLTVNNSTIFGNSATTSGGGIFRNGTQTITLNSTIVAGNLAAVDMPDIGSTTTAFNIAGNANLVGVASEAGYGYFTLTGSLNQVGTFSTPLDPVLGPLALNGGTTLNRVPQSGSPALSAGANPLGLATDQRGGSFIRAFQGTTDIGAVEGFDPRPQAVFTTISQVVSPGVTPNTIEVTYSSSLNIDATSFSTSNIRLFDPLNNPITINSFSPDVMGNAPTIKVTYSFTPPTNLSAGWDFSDNGVYSIRTADLVANAVKDTAGVPESVALDRTIGVISVAIPTDYIVDTLDDTNPGGGGVMGGDAYSGDLRYVLTKANADAGPAAITFSSAFNTLQTITLGAALPTLTGVTTITGPTGGVRISGNNLYQVLKIDVPSTALNAFTLSNLRLSNGSAASGTARALDIGNESVTLNNVTVENLTAGAGGGIIITGAGANVTINNSTLTGSINSTTNGAALRVAVASVTLTIVESTINSNTTTTGVGGVYFTSTTGSLTVNRSTVSSNRGSTTGGVRILGGASLNIINSTFNANGASTSTAGAGAIYVTSTTVTLNNNTIVGNTAALTGSNGGGVYIASGSINLTSNIIAGNTGAQDIHSTVTLTTGGLGANYLGNKNALLTYGGSNVLGTAPALSPLGNNGGPTLTMLPLPGSPVLNVGNSSLLSPNVDQRGVARGVTPNIGSVEGFVVAPSGVMTPVGTVTAPGATPNTVTVTYSSGTASIDYGSIGITDIEILDKSNNPLTITGFSPPTSGNFPSVAVTYTFTPPGGSWDQADNLTGPYTVRLKGGEVFDTNAVSASSVTLGSIAVSIPVIYTVNDAGDAGTGVGTSGDLRYVINQANLDGATSEIVFDKGVFGSATTISLGSTLPTITSDLTITGTGAKNVIISGNNAYRVLNITDGTGTVLNVKITGVTIADGNATTGLGAGISVTGENLELDGVHLRNNTNTVSGGGLGMSGANSITLKNSTISGNQAGNFGGAGIYQTGSGATVLIQNSTIANNTAIGGSAQGGAFCGFSWSGTMTIQNSTITRNSAASSSGGGAIRITSGTITLDSSIVAGNVSPTDPDFEATTVSAKFSMIGVAGVGHTYSDQGGNVTGTLANPANPQLSDLADNGGQTPTMLPAISSPVYTKGSNPAGLMFDQRGTGFPRVLLSQANMGAVEGSDPNPSAKLTTATNVVAPGSTPNTVVVTYTDNIGIDGSSINPANIEIRDQFNNPLTITGAVASPMGNGTPISVTYTFTPPVNGAAGWDASDNGVYTISTTSITMDQVLDIDTPTPFPVKAATLGSFNVSIPAVYTVTVATDNSPTMGGEGSGLSGDLRYVLTQANLTPGSTDTIVFGPLFNTLQQIVLGAVELSVTDGVIINGPGADKLEVYAGGSNRVFNIANGSGKIAVEITDMKIANGAPTTGLGGNILVADESLTLNRVWIEGGSSVTGGAGIATSAAGSLTILNSTLNANNTSGTNIHGGAVYLTGATNLLIRNSTFSGNNVTGFGGGLYGTTSAAVVSIENSTFTQNGAPNSGGAIYISGGTISIESTAIAGNVGAAEPDIFAGKVNSKNSAIGVADAGITSLNNLGGTISGTYLTPLDAKIDLSFGVVSPGKMPTHKLLDGSPLFNAGSNPAGLATDQNGNTRTLQGVTDIGAVEALAIVPTATLGGIGNVTVTGSTPSSFTVTYIGNTALDASTFDVTNVTLAGPGGPITIKSATPDLPGNGTPRTVTYTFDPPGVGNTWTDLQNGDYTITMVGSEVFDTTSPTPYSVLPGTLGVFTVAIPKIYTVNITTDDTPVTGKSTGVSSGDLRWAIDQANNDGFPSQIVFDGSVFTSGTIIQLAQGELPISQGVTIVGPGAANLDVKASPSARVFNVADTVTVNAHKVSISGMTISGATVTVVGAGIFVNGEDLTLTGVNITGNTSTSEGGGGVYLTGTGGVLSVISSNVNNNRVNGTLANGGGIYVRGTQTLFVTNSTVSGNTAGEDGAGIYFFSGGSLTMSGSTVSGNFSNVDGASNGGAGLYLWGATATIVNSTFANNNSNNNQGGGIVLLQSSTLTLKNSTIAYNNAGTNQGGNIRVSSGTLTMTSSLVTGGIAATGPDIGGAVSASNSLVGNTAGATVTGAGNKTDVAAGLETTLALNGAPAGSPLTLALQTGSVAINAGSNPDNLTTDQRGAGFARVIGGTADIGAYEVQTVSLPSKVSGGIVINNGAAQRSRVTSLKVNFDNPISFNDISKAFILTRDTGGNPSVGLNTVLDGSGLFVTITFTGGEVDAPPGNQTVRSLVDGKYTFTIVASEVANGFDGGMGVGTNYVLNSTSYVGGVTPTPATGIFRNFGDATGDGFVGADDFLAFRLAFLTANDTFDYDGANNVDATVDFLQFRLNFLTSV